MLMICNLCPQNCKTDRSNATGKCGTPETLLVSRIGTHMWEEPCISGTKGSGTVFFAGCNLRCRFCQNYNISTTGAGAELTVDHLVDVFLYLQNQGVHNINLVSPSHYALQIAKSLQMVKHRLAIPVIYNTNAYEKPSMLALLDGLVDVFLPDLKFFDKTLSLNLCGAASYFNVATAAVTEMRRQQPFDKFNDDGMILNGVIVRHLVLPNCTEDSKKVLDWLVKFDSKIFVSLMSQYFPPKFDDTYAFLNKRLSKRQYNAVTDYFFNVGLKNGFMQNLSSATADYVPNFDLAEIKSILDSIRKST